MCADLGSESRCALIKVLEVMSTSVYTGLKSSPSAQWLSERTVRVSEYKQILSTLKTAFNIK
jgi:hypothetical protein